MVLVEVHFKSRGAVLTISDLSAATGRAPSALRFYEREGFLRSTGRSAGKRIYDEGAVEQVALVDFLQRCGLTVAEIRELVDASGRIDGMWREVMAAKIEDLRRRRARIDEALVLLEHSVGCPEPRLETCPVFRAGIRHHVRTLGSEPKPGC
jgi:DNA-binding transcriptional MerR regulator